MAKLLYQGHASFRLVSDKGVVVYVDPFAGEGYDLPADIVLVTHRHDDHNQVHLVRKKPKCRVITNEEALVGGTYNSFKVRRVSIDAVPATNEHHDPRECVGYIIVIDGVKLYAAGDTSETDAMGEMFWQKIDYALLPIDGVRNMGPRTASICAARIGSRYAIPIHMKPGTLFDIEMARKFDIPNRLILRPGEEIELEADI